MTRRQYETARPWKKSGMARQEWEELLLLLPEGFVDACHREADADRLVEAMFGKVE